MRRENRENSFESKISVWENGKSTWGIGNFVYLAGGLKDEVSLKKENLSLKMRMGTTTHH